MHSTADAFTLVAERRSPLANHVSKHRKAAVQPDYALWANGAQGEECRFIAEAKHYLRSKRQDIGEVFIDYARAHPRAQVHVVNHGPNGDAPSVVKTYDPTLHRRCRSTERMTTLATETRRAFASAVRECVGEPIISRRRPSATSPSELVIVLDISPSAFQTLRTKEGIAFIEKLILLEKPAMVVTADTLLRGSQPVASLNFETLLSEEGYDTALATPVMALAATYGRVVIVTDADGVGSLNGVKTADHPVSSSAPAPIVVLVI